MIHALSLIWTFSGGGGGQKERSFGSFLVAVTVNPLVDALMPVTGCALLRSFWGTFITIR